VIIDVGIEMDLSGLRSLEVTAAEFERQWKDEIQRQLLFIQGAWMAAVSGHTLTGMSKPVNSTRYAASISDPASLDYPFNGDEFSGRVIATDSRVVMRIEKGYASFDMKPGLLSGAAAQTGAHGQKYVTVPLSHSIPGSTGQKGRPMPQEIYEQARRLHPGERLGDLGGYGRRSKLHTGVNAEAIRRQKPAPMRENYTWRYSPYAGLARVGRLNQQGYMTYRRVSETWVDEKGERRGTNAAAFIHPGQAPNPVMEAVRAFIEPQIYAAFEALVRQAGGESTPA
jgi:hypothetical protein